MNAVILSERWQAILLSFEENNMARGLTKTTCRELKACIHEFILFAECNNIEFPHQCNSTHLLHFFQHLTNRPKSNSTEVLQGSTPNHHVYALRTFFRWLFNTGAITFNPIVQIKFPKYFSKTVEAISIASVRKLFNACETNLERILLSLFYGCGLRRSEGQDLLISDIDCLQWKVIVRKGKFSKRREVPISRHLQTNFINYLSSYHSKSKSSGDFTPLLVDENGIKLEGSRAYLLIQRIVERSNLSHVKINLHIAPFNSYSFIRKRHGH
ncbi:MAG: tyrosine-type recombinase/integrase [Bacteroidetes bacterium]|nr:tyrosine-type recombinase/integrase [Bacteroidota bacterium]